MLLALTLVAADGSALAAAGARARSALAAAGARVKEPRPLGADVVDWFVEGGFAEAEADAAALRATLRPALDPLPVDWALQPAAGRRRRLLVADMDSTVIGCEGLDELADLAGCGPEVAAVTARAMAGELAFEPALRERVARLAGQPVTLLERCLRERVRLDPGVRTLVATMKGWGARAVLVSGGFHDLADPVAAEAGFDAVHANRLLQDGERLTGGVAEPILGRAAKLQALRVEAADLGVTPDAALAVGDGANDLDMLGAAGLGVAFHAKPVVAAAAHAAVRAGDLSVLLYFQGVSRTEWLHA